MRKVLFLFLLPCILSSSEIPNFERLSNTKGSVFLLSTPRSGTNLITGSLLAITRKPISWIHWRKKIFRPFSKLKKHSSYNRLGLPLISDIPLLYRTHYELLELSLVPSTQNKLIFVTRNPKELLFRALSASDFESMSSFLNAYLKAFKVYENWHPKNRFLVFYEDFIQNSDEMLLQILAFIEEKPEFFDDYIANKQLYLSKLFESYREQHMLNSAGLSAMDGPKAIFYTKEVDRKILIEIDQYIAKIEPGIWENYLKRFETCE